MNAALPLRWTENSLMFAEAYSYFIGDPLESIQIQEKQGIRGSLALSAYGSRLSE
jgi:hypothetical protein